jgi:CubicO group peptidase (beta-lactamase class C family)
MPWDLDGPYWMLRGNGGLLSTANDLRLWVHLFESDLLPPASRRWMTTEHIPIAPGIANGCAWALSAASEGQERMIYHHGSNGVFSAALRWFPERRQVLVVLSSEARHAAHVIAKELWR